jgi:hypothetical protein
MSTKNKKSVASQALLEMDAITSALKEESKKSLNTLLTEAVKNALREECDEEKEDDGDDYEVSDNKKDSADKKEKKEPKKPENEAGNPNDMEPQKQGGGNMQQPQSANPQIGGQEVPGEEGPNQMGGEMPQGEEGMDTPGAGGEEESWDEFSDYQVGDGNTYDLTGENDYDTVVKVYKLLNDDDQVVVQQDNDKIHLKDNEAGTEYLIDLGAIDNESGEGESQEEPMGDEPMYNEPMGGEERMPNNLNESFDDFDDMAGIPDDYEEGEPEFDDEFYDGFGDEFEEDEPEFDDEFDDGFEDEFGDGFEEDGLNSELYEGKIKNKKTRKPMKESKEVLFEVDLGYTDNYQDKDPIAGLSNNEPAKGKKSWHKGVPTGTAKPWAGDSKSKGDPFKTTQKVEGSVNEGDEIGGDMADMAANMEEQTNVGGFVQQNSVTTTHTSNSSGRKARSMRGNKTTGSADPRYSSATNESKELRAIKNENKELKKAILELRNSLNEAYITNVNLGKITKLFLENATSQKEKIEIVNRFANEAKTLEQSKMLYESIDKQLKSEKKKSLNLNESSVTAKGTKELNEQKVYKSDDLLKTIDFMNRVLNC